jgi:asparagine synthase (glutamine-hydrolysing)
MDEPVKTFSIGFEEKDYSELEYARQVADIFNTDHQELTVKAQDGSFLLKLAEYFNEPFADPAMIPTYFLSGMAKERVTVALNGDAGDENFAGYPRYVKNSDNYPWFINNKDINNFSLFKGMDSPEKKITAENISYYQRLIHFGEWDKDKMYSEEMKGITDSFCSAEIMMNLLNSLGSASDVDRMTFADFGLYLPEVLMVKVDFASMAHSLEVRSPMLDHEFMELCASIPSELKLKNGEVTKYILKKYSEKYLPDNIIYRNKMGFGVPLDYWFRNEMKELLVDTLTSSKALSRGYFRPEFIKELIEEHMGGRNRQYQLYNLLMLEIWHNIFIDGISHG